MSRMVGTISRGVRAPIIKSGDDLVKIVTDSILDAAKEDGYSIRNRDIIAMTESIVARAQGNYATVDDIANDVKNKFGGETVGVIFPILSRNRFSICLRGMAKGAKKIVLMLSYPSDEVGNELVSLDQIDEAGINPFVDVLTEEKYRELFGQVKHPFTGVDYVGYYKNIIESENLVNTIKEINKIVNGGKWKDDALATLRLPSELSEIYVRYVAYQTAREMGYNEFNSAVIAKNAGVKNFDKFHNSGYKGLYNGETEIEERNLDIEKIF